MDGLKIFWTHTAIKQRDHVFDYWNKRNKSKTYSKKLNQEIRERVDLLRDHSEMGKAIDYVDTRMISMGHYSILYKVNKPNILITGFWDNRQDPLKLLRFLKSK